MHRPHRHIGVTGLVGSTEHWRRRSQHRCGDSASLHWAENCTVLAGIVLCAHYCAPFVRRIPLGMITLSVHWMCWRPVMHVQTCTSYSVVCWLCSLSFLSYRLCTQSVCHTGSPRVGVRVGVPQEIRTARPWSDANGRACVWLEAVCECSTHIRLHCYGYLPASDIVRTVSLLSVASLHNVRCHCIAVQLLVGCPFPLGDLQVDHFSYPTSTRTRPTPRISTPYYIATGDFHNPTSSQSHRLIILLPSRPNGSRTDKLQVQV